MDLRWPALYGKVTIGYNVNSTHCWNMNRFLKKSVVICVSCTDTMARMTDCGQCVRSDWPISDLESIGPTHWTHDVVATLNQRQTLNQRHWLWFNVATTSCAQWVQNRLWFALITRKLLILRRILWIGCYSSKNAPSHMIAIAKKKRFTPMDAYANYTWKR